MTEITWPQFKHQHAGKDNEEISTLWKRFKEGKYVLPNTNQINTSEEAPREESEIEELSQIQPVAELESDTEAAEIQHPVGPSDEATSEGGEDGKDPPSSVKKRVIPCFLPIKPKDIIKPHPD